MAGKEIRITHIPVRFPETSSLFSSKFHDLSVVSLQAFNFSHVLLIENKAVNAFWGYCFVWFDLVESISLARGSDCLPCYRICG